MEQKNTMKMPHHIIVEDREKVSVVGVIEVLSFDETAVLMNTSMGELLLRGENLHIAKTDIESGQLLLSGKICELVYRDPSVGGNLLSRLFKN